MIRMNFSIIPAQPKANNRIVKNKQWVRNTKMTSLILEKPKKCGSCGGAK